MFDSAFTAQTINHINNLLRKEGCSVEYVVAFKNNLDGALPDHFELAKKQDGTSVTFRLNLSGNGGSRKGALYIRKPRPQGVIPQDPDVLLARAYQISAPGADVLRAQAVEESLNFHLYNIQEKRECNQCEKVWTGRRDVLTADGAVLCADCAEFTTASPSGTSSTSASATATAKASSGHATATTNDDTSTVASLGTSSESGVGSSRRTRSDKKDAEKTGAFSRSGKLSTPVESGGWPNKFTLPDGVDGDAGGASHIDVTGELLGAGKNKISLYALNPYSRQSRGLRALGDEEARRGGEVAFGMGLGQGIDILFPMKFCGSPPGEDETCKSFQAGLLDEEGMGVVVCLKQQTQNRWSPVFVEFDKNSIATCLKVGKQCFSSWLKDFNSQDRKHFTMNQEFSDKECIDLVELVNGSKQFKREFVLFPLCFFDPHHPALISALPCQLTVPNHLS